MIGARSILALALLLMPATIASAHDPIIPSPDAITSCAVESGPPPIGAWKPPQVTCDAVLEFLAHAKAVSKDVWLHSYSHVGLADYTGRLTLRQGGTVHWLIRPGGLGTLSLRTGSP